MKYSRVGVSLKNWKKARKEKEEREKEKKWSEKQQHSDVSRLGLYTRDSLSPVTSRPRISTRPGFHENLGNWKKHPIYCYCFSYFIARYRANDIGLLLRICFCSSNLYFSCFFLILFLLFFFFIEIVWMLQLTFW